MNSGLVTMPCLPGGGSAFVVPAGPWSDVTARPSTTSTESNHQLIVVNLAEPSSLVFDTLQPRLRSRPRDRPRRRRVRADSPGDDLRRRVPRRLHGVHDGLRVWLDCGYGYCDA